MVLGDRLNGTLEDLAGTIGYSATCALVDWLGGFRVWVPGTVGSHPIIELIGATAYAALVREYGGAYLAIPLDSRRDVARQARAIAGLHASGLTVLEIARAFGLSTQTVDRKLIELQDAGIADLIATGEYRDNRTKKNPAC